MAHTDAPAESDVAASAEPPATIPISEAILAPWRYMFRPTLAAQIMYRSSGAGLLLSFVQPAVLAIVIVEVFSVIGAMQWSDQRWTGDVIEHHMAQRSFSAALQHILFTSDALDLLIAVVLFVMFLVLWLAVAVVNVPRIPVGAPPKRVLTISLQAAASTFGLATVLLAIGSYCNVEATRLQMAGGVAIQMNRPAEHFALAQAVHTLLGLSALFLWGIWLFLALRGIRKCIPLPVSSYACENCGYDLTHQSETGRCTECGQTLADSTTRKLARPDTPWEKQSGLRTWLATTGSRIFEQRGVNAGRRVEHGNGHEQ